MPATVRELPQHWQLSPRPTVTVERRGLGKAEGGISHVQESLFPLTLSSLAPVPPSPSVCIPFDLIIADISYFFFVCIKAI